MHPNLLRIPEAVPVVGGEFVTSFGVAMLFAFLTAALIHRSEMRRLGLDPDHTWDFLFAAVVGGILGAKLYYVLLNWRMLLQDPAALVFARGGLVWYGGFLLATALVVWLILRKRLPLGTVADAAAPALAAAYAVGRVGCFLVGDDYGKPTDAFVGVRFPRGSPPTRAGYLREYFGVEVDPALVEKYGELVPVHPTQLYEVALSLLIFLFLWRIRDHRHAPGWLFTLYLALAGAERFAVEFFRAKDDRFFGPLTLAQLISLALVVVGAGWAVRLSRARAAGTGAREQPASAG